MLCYHPHRSNTPHYSKQSESSKAAQHHGYAEEHEYDEIETIHIVSPISGLTPIKTHGNSFDQKLETKYDLHMKTGTVQQVTWECHRPQKEAKAERCCRYSR